VHSSPDTADVLSSLPESVTYNMVKPSSVNDTLNKHTPICERSSSHQSVCERARVMGLQQLPQRDPLESTMQAPPSLLGMGIGARVLSSIIPVQYISLNSKLQSGSKPPQLQSQSFRVVLLSASSLYTSGMHSHIPVVPRASP
jgi:hypothetical protein